jgi:hypothetical protein
MFRGIPLVELMLNLDVPSATAALKQAGPSLKEVRAYDAALLQARPDVARGTMPSDLRPLGVSFQAHDIMVRDLEHPMPTMNPVPPFDLREPALYRTTNPARPFAIIPGGPRITLQLLLLILVAIGALAFAIWRWHR